MPSVSSYDLHLHSRWSYDALVPVEAYFRRARLWGVKVIAITEHHVLDSLDEVAAVASRYPDVRAIPAAEISIATSLGALDFVCYGFRRPFSPAFQKVVDRYHDWQREFGAAYVRAVRRLGFDYTDAQWRALLHSYRPRRIIEAQGYTRVRNGAQRAYFVERGFIPDIEAHEEFTRRLSQAYPLPPYPSAVEVVPALREACAIIALAHPSRGLGEGGDRALDQLREECALGGIECAHPEVPPEFGAACRRYCERHGLVSVAGSDTHTRWQMDDRFARHGGAEEWLGDFLERVAGNAK